MNGCFRSAMKVHSWTELLYCDRKFRVVDKYLEMCIKEMIITVLINCIRIRDYLLAFRQCTSFAILKAPFRGIQSHPFHPDPNEFK